MTALPDEMNAIDPAGTGGPDVLILVRRPVPRPGPGEVLIQVAAAGVNRPDVVQRLGLTLLTSRGEGRYPKVDVASLIERGPDLILLPDEPYPFGPEDGPEAFPGIPTALVSGRDLTWYGPSMATSRARLSAGVTSALERE